MNEQILNHQGHLNILKIAEEGEKIRSFEPRLFAHLTIAAKTSINSMFVSGLWVN